jgi:hypothetical protein
VLFTDDTNIMVNDCNQGGLQTALNITICYIISRFKANFLLLNSNKTYNLEFRPKNCIDTTLDITHFNKSIANISSSQFLCLVTDDTLTCDNHMDHLICTLNSACLTISAVTAML